MTLHDLLNSGSLAEAALWLRGQYGDDLAKHPDILRVLEAPEGEPDRETVACALAAYLLIIGDHAGARLAYSQGLAVGDTAKVLDSCSIENDPTKCFEFEDSIADHALVPMTLGNPSLGEASTELRIAKISRATVYGLTFLPVSAQGKTSLFGFVHNSSDVTKLLRLEEMDTIPVGTKNGLLGCFDGVDSFDEGILIGNSHNFGHWLLNHLPRVALASSLRNLASVPLVVGENFNRMHQECLEVLGYPESRLIRLKKGRLARFKTLWAPMMPCCGGPDGLLYWSPKTFDLLRARLRVASRVRGGRGDRIYLVRRAAKWRRVLNEDVIMSVLSRRGFKAVDPGSLSIADQQALVADAEVIVSPYGAGINIVFFAPPGTKVIELAYQRPNLLTEMNTTPALCQHFGQPYARVLGIPQITDGNPLNYDFMVHVSSLRNALQSMGIDR